MIPEQTLPEVRGAPDRTLELLTKRGAIIIRNVLPLELEQAAHRYARDLFELPDDARAELISAAPGEPGFGTFGQARAIDTGAPNLLESWTISPSSPHRLPSVLHKAWYTFTEVAIAIRAASEQLLLSIDHALNAHGGLYGSVSSKHFAMQLIHYPTWLSTQQHPHSRRQSVHTDRSVITALPRATHPGLFIIEPDGRRLPIDVPSGGITIMAGTTLQFLTNHLVPACRHTVETDDEPDQSRSNRISMAYFFNPIEHSTLTPINLPIDSTHSSTRLDTDQHYESYMRDIYGE